MLGRTVRKLAPVPAPHRLGVYVDDVYRETAVGGRTVLSSDRPFVVFALEVAGHCGGLTLFGRLEKSAASFEHVLPDDTRRPAVLWLPHGNRRGAARYTGDRPRDVERTGGRGHGLGLWTTPLGLLLIGLAVVRRRRVVLGVGRTR